ncbi:4-(cytidine 5'-diphospho)-2-C-methyl-D-erythritol kinase [bacterium]|nr:4-(cytidine 5'-diphospho)-2-C-methyl-D-erythritol kinase [bacterium]
MVTIRAYAKINLDLRLAKRRPDGYHPIDTMMIRVDVFDLLEANATQDGKITLEIKGDENLSPGPDNLIVRAAEALRQMAPSGSGAHLKLTKKIPQGAGMGGGSSNAAAALLLLSDLWKVRVQPADLDRIGATLGSDVPFFLQPHAARCTGRGEILDPTPLKNLPWALLLHPGFSSPTASAYATYARNPCAGLKGAPLTLERADGSTLDLTPQNDLEPAVEERFLWIASAREWMGNQPGVLAARMSGSGSTVFGLFPRESQARKAAEKAQPHFGTETWIQVARLLSGQL